MRLRLPDEQTINPQEHEMPRHRLSTCSPDVTPDPLYLWDSGRRQYENRKGAAGQVLLESHALVTSNEPIIVSANSVRDDRAIRQAAPAFRECIHDDKFVGKQWGQVYRNHLVEDCPYHAAALTKFLAASRIAASARSRPMPG